MPKSLQGPPSRCGLPFKLLGTRACQGLPLPTHMVWQSGDVLNPKSSPMTPLHSQKDDLSPFVKGIIFTCSLAVSRTQTDEQAGLYREYPNNVRGVRGWLTEGLRPTL